MYCPNGSSQWAHVEEPQPAEQVPPGWTVALLFLPRYMLPQCAQIPQSANLQVGGGYLYNPEPGTAPRFELREDRAREQADGKIQRVGSHDQKSQRPDILISTDSLGV